MCFERVCTHVLVRTRMSAVKISIAAFLFLLVKAVSGCVARNTQRCECRDRSSRSFHRSCPPGGIRSLKFEGREKIARWKNKSTHNSQSDRLQNVQNVFFFSLRDIVFLQNQNYDIWLTLTVRIRKSVQWADTHVLAWTRGPSLSITVWLKA